MADKTLDISIPHKLGKEEARRRIAEGLSKARASYASQVGQVEESWNGDRAEIAVNALGQRITGWVDVRETDVQVHVVLPWLFGIIAERLRPQIEAEAKRVLSLPPA